MRPSHANSVQCVHVYFKEIFSFHISVILCLFLGDDRVTPEVEVVMYAWSASLL